MEKYRIRLSQIFDSLFIFVGLCKSNGTLLEANKTALDVAGIDLADVLDQPFEETYWWSYDTKVQQTLKETIQLAQQGKSSRYDAEIRVSEGKLIPIDFQIVPIFNSDGEVNYIIPSAIDISDRKRMENHLKASEQALTVRNRHLQEFSQSLEKMVELRTLKLQRQSKRLRWLNRKLINVEQHERKRLAGLIHDHLQQLLVASRINLKRLKDSRITEKQFHSLNNAIQLLDEAITVGRNLTAELRPPMIYEAGLKPALLWLIQQMKHQYNLTILIEQMDDCHDIGEDIKLTLYDCVRELFYNIFKHAQVREATFSLINHEKSINISVQDQGCGFEIKPINTHRTEHMSYGLFNIQERIESLDGVFDIESTPGRGTKTNICIPLKGDGTDCQKNQPLIENIQPEAEEQPLDPIIRILLVDDHKIVREGIAGIIEEVPSLRVVGFADNGSDAITKVDALNPDIVIMDVNMPQMNGIDATRQISQRWKDVSVIGLSIQGEETIAETMMQAGAEDYFYKGGNPDDLISAIIRAADRKRQISSQ